MESEREMRRQAYVQKAQAEVADLESAGIIMAGNAFSPVLFVKGQVRSDELQAGALLSGADGNALRASLGALGYAPEDWAALATVAADGEELSAEDFLLAVTTLDPATLVLCDEAAAGVARNAYADDLVDVESLDSAMLLPGLVVRIRGMRVLNLGGFEASLSDKHQKQVMWARLKQIPPLGEPY